MRYSDLQNGSDIRGIAMAQDEGYEVNLTPQAVADLSAAYATWLKAYLGKDKLRVSIGRDSRLSGEELTKAAITGLTSAGVDCFNLHMASTPAMFMSTVLMPYQFDASIMITASHLPWYRNGMKFFTAHGGLEKKEITEVIACAEDIHVDMNQVTPASKDLNFMEVYCEHLRTAIRTGCGCSAEAKPLSGLHIIVDAGNGAGGFFESGVLTPLGANTTGSLYLEPDGHFPHHIPNPEDKKASECIQKATVDSHADLGIIFDTDVDRAGAVLSDGTVLTRNALIAILSRIALSSHPGTTIVTDSVTSTGLGDFIREYGGVHHRFKRGYKNVIDESIRLNSEGTDSQLAIETSGHGAWKENYFLDDGAYLMVKLLIEMGKGHKLHEMIKDLREPKEACEVRMPVTVSKDVMQDKMDEVLKLLTDSASSVDGWSVVSPNFEGVRISCDADHGNGWLLLRKSLHEPLMPLNIESDSSGGCKKIATVLYDILRGSTVVDLTPLAKYIN